LKPSSFELVEFLLKSQRRLHWSRAEIQEFQDKRVRSVISSAYENVTFYRELFKSAGLHPSDIKGVGDLNKIPIVTKRMMKKYPAEDLISKQYSPDSLKTISTGGSTGQPFKMYINSTEDSWRKAIYLRANITCGQKTRDRWVAVIDPQYSSGENRVQKFLRIYYRVIVPVLLPRTIQYETVAGMSPDVLDGFPNSLNLIAKEERIRGNNRIHPRIIFGSGELVDKSSIEYIEKAFGAPYYDQFGCTEIDRSAWQCKERNGYHLDIDSVVTQFVDKDGEEAGLEEEGEIVYTSLFNYAFPIIRYNVEDIGMRTDDECGCGISLPMMKVVQGRSNSCLVFPDDKVITPMRFIELLGAFKLDREIDQYQVIQETKTSMKILVKKTSAEVDEEEVAKTLKSNIVNGLPEVTGIDKMGIEVDFVDDIPRSPRGKLNVVTSHVN
jgi:phenylacetate-CoA ligase